MGQVIVITSGKGGVGKTTTTANMGAALAKLDKKVVLVDGDIGLRNLDLVMGLENRIVFNLVDVVEGTCELSKALVKDKRFNNLYLLPAAQTKDKDSVNPAQMKALTDGLRKDFDYIIVDCPAGIEQGFKNAISGADRAIVVATPEMSSVRDADRIIGLLNSNGIKDTRLIVNRIKMDMVKTNDMMNVDDVVDVLAVKLIGVVPDDKNIVIATNNGEPAVNDLKSTAGKAYINIAKRVMGEEVEFLDLEEDHGLMSKIKKIFGVNK